MVFTAIMLEVVFNYYEKKKQFEELPTVDMKHPEEKPQEGETED